jgi:predicted GNAT family acetyltransferase
MVAARDIDVVHHPVAGRFLTEVDGHQAHLDYELVDGVMHITQTRVPSEIGGRGVAGELTRVAMEHARTEGLKVRPMCSYAEDWLRRHPGYADLVG